MTSRAPQARRELTQNLLLLFLTCLVLALVGELGLRAWQKARRGTALFSWLPDHRPATHFPYDPFLVFGPRINYQLPNKSHPALAFFNHQGFRTTDTIGPKPPGEFRIIALGGSTTEDANTIEGRHWPLTLQDELRASGHPNVRVLNAGMGAYSSAHSLVQLEFDMLPFQPDLVLVLHNVNDLTVNYYAARFGRQVDPSYHVKYGIKSYTGVVDDGDVVLSRLWHSARVRLDMLLHGVPTGAISDSFSIDQGLAAFRRNLRSIAAVGRIHGTEVVFLTMPVSRSRAIYDSTRAQARGSDPGYFPSHERFLVDFDAYNDAVKAAGRDAQVAVIDMEAALRGHDAEFFLDVVHYSDEGSHAFGRALAAQLAPLLPASASAPSH